MNFVLEARNLLRLSLYGGRSKKACVPLRLTHTVPIEDSTSVKLAHHVYPGPADESPLYILHGLFGSKGNWNSLAKVFARKREVVTVDSRNHGASPECMTITFDAMCQDLRSLLQDNGHEKVQLMGHSMGGKTCMLLAMRYPELVDKLVVVDVSPEKSPSSHGMWRILDSLIGLTFDDSLTLHTARKQADKDLQKTLLDPVLRHFLLTNLTKKGKHFRLRVDPHIIKANLEAMMGFPEETNSYDGPTFFIGGQNSPYIRAESETIKRYFPRALVTHIPDAGHWVHAEQPQQFLQAVDQFLTRES